MEGIDGHNSSARKKSCFENCANLFHDPSCKPTSFVHKDLHDDFNISHKLLETEEVKLLVATPYKIKDKMGEARSKVSFLQILHHPVH